MPARRKQSCSRSKRYSAPWFVAPARHNSWMIRSLNAAESVMAPMSVENRATKSSRSIEAACCEVLSVGRTLIDRAKQNYTGFFEDTDNVMTATKSGCSKLYSDAVYTGLSNGARGIPFPNYGHQGLTIENGNDAKRGHAALPEKCVQTDFVEGV